MRICTGVALTSFFHKAALAYARIVSRKVFAAAICPRTHIAGSAFIDVRAPTPRAAAREPGLNLAANVAAVVAFAIAVVACLAGVQYPVAALWVDGRAFVWAHRVLDGVDEELRIGCVQALRFEALEVQQARVTRSQRLGHRTAAACEEPVHGDGAARRAGRRPLIAHAGAVDAADCVDAGS